MRANFTRDVFRGPPPTLRGPTGTVEREEGSRAQRDRLCASRSNLSSVTRVGCGDASTRPKISVAKESNMPNETWLEDERRVKPYVEPQYDSVEILVRDGEDLTRVEQDLGLVFKEKNKKILLTR